MYRIILIVLRLLVKIPYYLIQLHKHENGEKYSLEERFAFTQKFLGAITKAGRVNIECTGLENLPKEPGYLMAPNHQGLFDPVMIAVTHPTPCTAVIKKELMSAPIVRQIAIINNGIAMDRDDIRGSVKIIKQVGRNLKEGRTYFIFPEGTRSKLGNKMIEFKGGTFKSAKDAKCPIVPVACIDSYKVFDSKSIKKMTAQVHYLPAIYPEEIEGMSTVEIAELVQARVKAKIDEVTGE